MEANLITRYKRGNVAGTHAPSGPALAMPFIEDEWWTAENEGRMVDLSNCLQQEENNNVSPASGSQIQGPYYQQNQLSLPNNGQQRLQQLLRSGTSAINNAVANNINNGRYNIASANPLLAEKLAATSSGIKQEPMSTDYNGTGMNYGNASPMQRVPSGKPQVHDAGGGKGKFC
ncbi:unnamed protein product, partial [Iphiclides podalirius]